MYYLSQESRKRIIKDLQGATTNKLFGLIGILVGIGNSQIKPNTTYNAKDIIIGQWMDDVLSLDTLSYNTDNELYVRFAQGWDDYFAESLGQSKINIYVFASFVFKFKPFDEIPSAEELLQSILRECFISEEVARKWFSFAPYTLKFEEFSSLQDVGKMKSDLKNALGLSQNTISFDLSSSSGSVKAKPHELTRAPFIQTLYAGMDSINCLLISRTDLESLYPTRIRKEGMNTKLQVIYFGSPGTGKSFTVNGNMTIEDEEESNVFRTTFHPDFDYTSFIGGYKPRTTEDNQIEYGFTPQIFTQAYLYAWKNPDKKTYLVIEEINRGNCAQIFGDLFQLLDRNSEGFSEYGIVPETDLADYLKKNLKVNFDKPDSITEKEFSNLKSGKVLMLPSNLYILATMNTSDQSLFPMDSAFKRRWDWEYIPIDYEAENKSKLFVIKIGDKEYNWLRFLKAVNAKILEATSSEDKQMGNFFIKESIDEKTFVNKVMFYLWNEICKEEVGTKNNFFRYDCDILDREFTFNQLFPIDKNILLLQSFVEKIIAENVPTY